MLDYAHPGQITFETRIESHKSVDKEKRYKEVKEALAHLKEGTAKEIAVLMCKWRYIPTSERNFTAPRLTELESKGIVKVIGKKKCEYSGKVVAVYKLCD
jgi:hypothetical protein